MRTDDTQAQHLALIPRAQKGDQGALGQLITYIDRRYAWMIKSLYSGDPMLSKEDIRGEFLEGIMGGIPVVRLDIGNPLFHLAQRGLWNAKSAVDAAKKYRRSEDITDPEFGDAGAERTQMDPSEIVVQRHFANHVTRVVSMAGLSGNEQKAFLLIMSGELGDPCEMGWNKDLADRLGVSPQRASQITAKLQYLFFQHDTRLEHQGGWAIR